MTTWNPRANELFLAARELRPPAERGAFLDRACGGDAGLRAEVEALLEADDRAGDFLQSPVPAVTVDQHSLAERPGAAVGPYKLLEQIGEGGFGVVFMAEQTQPVRRKVALKVLKPGMDTRQVVARFEAERQALAIMDHPNIARVFDGGATDSGRPYFVMELVRGLPITEFCDQNHLTPRQRLELFVSVCQAVQHAHQKGIIHRDIKPSNVLVTVHDTKPVVKVIDFGVAKALGQELTDKTLFTGFAQMIGTPLYMSPEQAGQSGLDIDTRSDIYSLGVLLYELLTGTTPFTKERFQKAAHDEIRRIIREEEPSKPSTKLSTADGLPALAANRGTEPAKLTRMVRGELDWMVMKALEKDRSRRYETANGFAADVQRYLNDETVQACPPSAGYRLRKFARRNKRALATAAVVGLALLSAVGALGWVVRDREAGRVRTAGEVNQFLQRAESLYADNKLPEAAVEVEKARGVLEAGGGDEELGRRVRQWLTDLDTAASLEEIRLDFDERENHDRGYADYARVFREYGIDVEALSAEDATARIEASRIRLDLVLALGAWAGRLKSDPRPQDPARWQRLTAIARGADPDPWRQRYQAAVEARDVQTLRELANGADPAHLRTRILAALGNSLRAAGDAETAVAFLRKARRQHPGDFLINSSLARALEEVRPAPWDDVLAFRMVELAARPRSSSAHYGVAVALQGGHRLDEAIVEYHEAIRLRPGFALAYNNLGAVLIMQKKLPEGIAASEKAIELDPKWSHPRVNLGNALKTQGKLPEAIACYRKAIELDAKEARAHNNLGNALRDQKKLDEAIAAYETAIQIDPKYALAYANLGDALSDKGKLDGAIAAYRKAIELDPKRASAYIALGNALTDEGKLDEAVAAYETATEIDPKYALAHANLGNALREQQKLPEAVAAYRRAIKHDPKHASAYNGLGVILSEQKKLDEAVAAFEKAIEFGMNDAKTYCNLGQVLHMRGDLPESVAAYQKSAELDPELAEPHIGLGNALKAQGKLNEAVGCYQKAIALAPKSALAHRNLGLALYDQERLDEAAASYRAAVKLDPRYLLAHNNLGNALYVQKKWEEAAASYRAAVKLEPRYANAHLGLGNALYGQKKWDEAVASYCRAIELNPRLVPAHFSLGNALKAQGKLDEAIATYRMALALDPNLAQARTELSSALAQKGWDLTSPDPQRAVAASREAVELVPRSVFAWQHLGWVQYRAGNWKASIEALEKSCELQEGGTGDSYQWIVLALAHARLAADEGLPDEERVRHRAESRRWYGPSAKDLDSKKWTTRPGGGLDQAVWDFRQEALKLIGPSEEKK